MFALRLLETGPARSLTELHNGEEMYAKLYDLCLKPETYEDRKAQRDEEIAALKAALEMMESEALLQVAPGYWSLRGPCAGKLFQWRPPYQGGLSLKFTSHRSERSESLGYYHRLLLAVATSSYI